MLATPLGASAVLVFGGTGCSPVATAQRYTRSRLVRNCRGNNLSDLGNSLVVGDFRDIFSRLGHVVNENDAPPGWSHSYVCYSQCG